MPLRFERQPWWRVPLGEPRRDAVRRPRAMGWLWPYWGALLLLAWAIHADRLPLRHWLAAAHAEPAPAEAAPPPEGPAEAPAAELPVALPAKAAATGALVARAPRIGRIVEDPLGFGLPWPEEPTPIAPEEPAEEPAAAEPASPEPVAVVRRDGPRDRTEPRPSRRRGPAARRAADVEPPARRPSEPDPPAAPEPRRPAPPAPSRGRTASGGSCEAAIASYREQVTMGDSRVPPDLTAARYGSVLNRGSYFAHCGVPDHVAVHICAAVQNGRAVGVTVRTKPSDRGLERCVAAAVRGLAFPSHPRMDVTRTTFE